jgi:hypothetical protein
MYNVNKVSLWDFDTKQIILSVGPVIDDPNEITIVYKGNSLISKFGGKVPQFKYSLGSTPVNEVEAMNVIAYPTEVQSEIHVAGLQEGNQIDIVSATGKRVTSFIAASDVEDISTNSFTAGVYYIMVYDGNILRAKRAFVKK